jgi:hypothetical protein
VLFKILALLAVRSGGFGWLRQRAQQVLQWCEPNNGIIPAYLNHDIVIGHVAQ